MYKLFTDKSELFECDIKLQGASLKKSKARLVVETQDYSLMFNGSISKGGKCEIPIRKLKGLIDEDTTGNIRLEVIAEDTFFTPWESDFEVETSKKVTVEVKSQTTKKPIVEAKVKVTTSEQQHVVNLLKLLIKEDKDKLVKLILKIHGNTITESKKREIKQYKIKAKDIKIAVKEVLGVKMIAEDISL